MKQIIVPLILINICFGYLEASEVFLSLEYNTKKDNSITKTHVISKKIENKNAVTAMDLISDVTGVFVTKAASQMKADVSIRGIGDSFRRIGLFVDGRPEKMAVYGCGVSQTLLSGNIEKIEIVKGPDSVLYGSDGFGGIVNIITSKPSKAVEGLLSSSYGTFNTQNYYVNLGGNTEKVIYNFSANKASSEGHLNNSGYNTTDYYLGLVYKIDDISEISIKGKYFTGTEFEPAAKTVNNAGIISPGAVSNWYDFKRGGADISYKRYYNSGKMEVMGYGDWGEHLFSDGFNSKDAMYGINAKFENEFFENNVLKYGAEYRLSDGKVIKGVKAGEWKKSELAIYALDEHKLFDKINITAGLRYNYDEISGEVFVPRAGLVYDLTKKISFKAAYSKGFRSPYINELYSLPSSNDKLDVEVLNNYEIGLNSKYFGINFDVTGFVINGDNIIQISNGKFSNSGSYVFKGFEASINGEILENLEGYAGYSYLDTGNLTQGMAKDKIDLSLDYKVYKFKFHIGAMVVGNYYAANNKMAKLNNFNVFNAKIHYNLLENLTLFTAIDNFTNQKYEMFIVSFGSIRIYEMPGTTATIGAKYKF